jgi:hypothetical protein
VKTAPETRTKKTVNPDDVIDRLDLPEDAKMVLAYLASGPAYYDRVVHKLKRAGVDVLTAVRQLVETERLVDGVVEKRDGKDDRLLLTTRPVEEWDVDRHFMAALAVRW